MTWTDILLVCFVLSLACNGVDPQIEDQIRERLCFRFPNDLFQSEKKSSFFSQKFSFVAQFIKIGQTCNYLTLSFSSQTQFLKFKLVP